MSSPHSYSLFTDRSFTARELGPIAFLQGWVAALEDFSEEMLAKHFAKVDFVAHVRHESGQFVGFLSAWSNGLGEAWINAALTHPEFDHEEIMRLMIPAALAHFPQTPVYAMPFVDEQTAFRAEGFKVYRREYVALANRNDAPGLQPVAEGV